MARTVPHAAGGGVVNDLYLAAGGLLLVALIGTTIALVRVIRDRDYWIAAHGLVACELADECDRYDELADRTSRYIASHQLPLTNEARRVRAQAGRN